MALVKCPKCRKSYDPGTEDLDDLPENLSRKVVCPACGQWARLPDGDAIAPPKLPPKMLKTMMSQATLVDDEPAPSPPPPPPPKPAGDDDEEGGAYTLTADAAPAAPVEDQSKKKKKKEKKAVVKRTIKKKTIQFADDWRKLLIAIWLMFAGMCVWGICWLLHLVIVLQGLLSSTLYSPLQLEVIRDNELQKGPFVIGLICNLSNLDAGKALYITEQALFLASGGCFLAAYCICLGVPNVFGTRGQTITLLIFSIINLLVTLLLKLLPAAGAMGYVMVPLVAPEICFSVASLERTLPLHVFWSAAPFWEFFGAIIFQAVFYGEPILFCVFLRSTALALKDDQWLEPRAQSLLRMGFGQFFMLLSFYMLSITGTTDVVGWTLLIVYLVWRSFLIGYIINYALVLYGSLARIKYLIDEDED
ncbi:MAG: hypothetical protein FJ271_04785 [Planctomycetes bacterium]|nr:hypothetical protein [Planctomycetota bacterium]